MWYIVSVKSLHHRRVREDLIPMGIREVFFQLNLHDWIIWNVKDEGSISLILNLSWVHLFLAAIWGIWKARNKLYFENVLFSSFKVLRQVGLMAVDMQLKFEQSSFLSLDPVNGRWIKPPPGFLKLNVDGSCRDGWIAFGGVLQDDNGNWLWGFAGKGGFQTTLYAELSALKHGLNMILERDHLCIVVESDSSQAINLIHDNVDASHPLLELILSCKRLHIQHIHQYGCVCGLFCGFWAVCPFTVPNNKRRQGIVVVNAAD